MSSTTPPASRDEANWLLAALSDASYARIVRLGDPVTVAFKEIVGVPDAPIEYAYFPRSGCLSVVTVMRDGSAIEVGTVGWEGMSGVALLHGVESVPTQCIAQLEATALRVPRGVFIAEVRENAELSSLLHRYAQAWTNQVGRAGSCNGVHTVEERCARWLLITHDRVASNELPLTQEFLGVMLGVRRASVTLAASSLQTAGLITYKRGRIIVLDRRGLEAAACECYAAMRASYDSLLPIEPAWVEARHQVPSPS